MLDRRQFVSGAGALAAGALANGTPVAAATHAFFTKEAFEAAQNAGKPILVDVWASWCPVCKAQQSILKQLGEMPKFKDVVILSMDFDVQKDALRFFGARQQSTLIAFRGRTEVARSVGDTNPASVEALISKSL